MSGLCQIRSTSSHEIEVAARHLHFGFTTKIGHHSARSKYKELARVTENMAEKEKLQRKEIYKY